MHDDIHVLNNGRGAEEEQLSTRKRQHICTHDLRGLFAYDIGCHAAPHRPSVYVVEGEGDNPQRLEMRLDEETDRQRERDKGAE